MNIRTVAFGIIRPHLYLPSGDSSSPFLGSEKGEIGKYGGTRGGSAGGSGVGPTPRSTVSTPREAVRGGEELDLCLWN